MRVGKNGKCESSLRELLGTCQGKVALGEQNQCSTWCTQV